MRREDSTPARTAPGIGTAAAGFTEAVAVTARHPVLVLFAHPAVARSRVNLRLLEAARSVPGVTVNDLYERYPDFDIDVAREQELLAAHHVIVMQHPFYWYSTPSILKEWQDLVLEHGWAYGRDGRALVGKVMLNALTAGGPEGAYQPEGANRSTIRELLAPLEQTARLCGMRYLAPFVVFGTHRLQPADIEAEAAEYAALLAGLRDGSFDLEAAGRAPLLRASTSGIHGA
jgi:glutathione-regulated potassium-efflux system ancillary protein KefG